MFLVPLVPTASASRRSPVTACVVRYGPILAGWALALLLSSPAQAASPPGAPCNPTGALGTSMGGCATPPVSPTAAPISSPPKTYFSSAERFRVKTGSAERKMEIRRNIAAWVARRVVPSATSAERELLKLAIQRLAVGGFPLNVEANSSDTALVTVQANTLNLLASRLLHALAGGRLDYRLNHTAVTGGTPGENGFVAHQLPIPPSGVVDAQKIFDTLYRIGQVPGFSRADALFTPGISVRSISFRHGREFTIHSDRRHWTRELRRQIALYVGQRVLATRENQARKIEREIADRAADVFWQPIQIELDAGNVYKVWVPARMLNNIKNALVAQAGVGSVRPGPVPARESLSAAGISGAVEDDSAFVPEPVQPSVGTLFTPKASAPPLENLLVHVTPAPTFAGSQIELDNYGYAPTGALMLNATGTVNNAGVAGGLFAVVASTSFGGMNAGTLSYSLPIDLVNRVGIDVNAMNYTLGEGFSPWGHGANAAQLTALGVSGSNYSGDVWGMQTFIEKPDRKLALKETLFLKEFQDTYSQTSQNDRSLPGGTLDLSGFRTLGKILASFDLADTEYDLTQGSGSDPANPFYNDTQGLQNYLTANGQLSYAVTSVWSVTLGTVDQQYIGGGVLDPMLQATLGGIANVMALPTASLFGNDLYVGTLTLTRTDTALIGSFASSLFFDAGQVTGIGTNYSAMGPGLEESVSSQHWFARGDLAVPIGALPTQILGQNITALTGGNIGQGGIPLQLWLSAGLRY
ncbi:MAG: hypothetical protein M1509_05050 [Nitrospirae bacterium]|nr:hypothetical protein [Nitrospirota bacterium]